MEMRSLGSFIWVIRSLNCNVRWSNTSSNVIDKPRNHENTFQHKNGVQNPKGNQGQRKGQYLSRFQFSPWFGFYHHRQSRDNTLWTQLKPQFRKMLLHVKWCVNYKISFYDGLLISLNLSKTSVAPNKGNGVLVAVNTSRAGWETCQLLYIFTSTCQWSPLLCCLCHWTKFQGKPYWKKNLLVTYLSWAYI